MNKLQNSSDRGFTLIELLVVIAIIALLLAILMPSLGKVKEKAQMVVCASNQKQVVLGLSTYASDQENKLPLSVSKSKGNGWHRPFELNWIDNIMDYTNVGFKKYVGLTLGNYLPEVKVFNCAVSKIETDGDWPPRENPLNKPVAGKYGDFYLKGGYASLHSTYTLLWGYQGFNPKESSSFKPTESYGDFAGPKKVDKGNKLVIQDSLFHRLNHNNVLWYLESDSWLSSHRPDKSEKGKPYFITKAKGQNPMDWWPEVKLNAGYMDGHVSSFNTKDGMLVKNSNASAILAR